MSFAGHKRPGGASSGAVVSFKRPRQDQIAVRSNEKSKQLVQSVSKQNNMTIIMIPIMSHL